MRHRALVLSRFVLRLSLCSCQKLHVLARARRHLPIADHAPERLEANRSGSNTSVQIGQTISYAEFAITEHVRRGLMLGFPLPAILPYPSGPIVGRTKLPIP